MLRAPSLPLLCEQVIGQSKFVLDEWMNGWIIWSRCNGDTCIFGKKIASLLGTRWAMSSKAGHETGVRRGGNVEEVGVMIGCMCNERDNEEQRLMTANKYGVDPVEQACLWDECARNYININISTDHAHADETIPTVHVDKEKKKAGVFVFPLCLLSIRRFEHGSKWMDKLCLHWHSIGTWYRPLQLTLEPVTMKQVSS